MIDPFNGYTKAITNKDKTSLLDDKEWLAELRSLLNIPSGGGGVLGGSSFSLADHTTDELPEGTTNLYSLWQEITPVSTTYIAPNNFGDVLLLGSSDGLAPIEGTFSGTIAVFNSPTNAGLNYFVNTSYGYSSFFPIGGLYISTHSGGTAASPTAANDGSWLGGHLFYAYDGSSYTSITSANSHIFPGLWSSAVTVSPYESEVWLGGLITPAVKFSTVDNVVTTYYATKISNAYTLPTSDGSADNVMKTDGAGTVSWGTVSASLSVTETEVDFGTTPTTDKLFTITDAGVSSTSKIIIQESGKPATGRAAGDAQWDSITYAAYPGTGSFTVYAKASGSVVGKRKVEYMVA